MADSFICESGPAVARSVLQGQAGILEGRGGASCRLHKRNVLLFAAHDRRRQLVRQRSETRGALRQRDGLDQATRDVPQPREFPRLHVQGGVPYAASIIPPPRLLAVPLPSSGHTCHLLHRRDRTTRWQHCHSNLKRRPSSLCSMHTPLRTEWCAKTLDRPAV